MTDMTKDVISTGAMTIDNINIENKKANTLIIPIPQNLCVSCFFAQFMVFHNMGSKIN
jgi:hypothetical protein